MIGSILTKDWLNEVYPKATIKAVQFSCTKTAGVKNKDWLKLETELKGATFFIGLVNANDIDGTQFRMDSDLIAANGSENNDYVQIWKFNSVLGSGTEEYFQLFGYLVTTKTRR